MQSIAFSFREFDRELIKHLSEKISLNLSTYSFSSFLLGISFPKALPPDETALLKKEFQFALVKELGKKLHATADFEKPEVCVTIDFNSKKIFLHVSSLFLHGIYKKFSRNLAQTIFYCPKCRGRGCAECSFRGKLGIKTIQELIAEPLVKAFQAKDNKFHGAGREDVDVRMLGNGREFVLELIEPKKRKANLRELQKGVNRKNKRRISVKNLCYVEKNSVSLLKESKSEKIYEAVVSCRKNLSREGIKKLKNAGFTVFQRTPERVSGRRADLVRERKAKILKTKILSKKTFSLRMLAESGLYVKEFVSGDGGRTIPSISSLLGNNCGCRQLDVVKILR